MSKQRNPTAIGKQYRTRLGMPARIIANDMKNEKPVVAAVTFNDGNEFCVTFYEDGKRWLDVESDYDLIEVSPYDDLKIGAPVMAKNYHERGWVRRHFAGVTELGTPLVFANGGSQWTSAGKVIVYDEVRCPTAADTSDIGA